MTYRIHLRELVAEALDDQWETFADDHPDLATVLDRELLVAGAIDAIEGDPDYHQSMAEALALEASMETIARIIGGATRRWLGRLV